MKQQKLFVRVICIVLAVLMVLSVLMMIVPVARAVTEADIQALAARRAELEEQLAQQAVVIQELTDNHALIIDRKAALDRQIELNRESIALMNEQIEAYDALIAEQELALDEARRVEESQSALFRSRVRAMEESGNNSYLVFLFSADSISEFLSRLGDISDIMYYDRQLEASLRQARSNVEQLMRTYEQTQLEQSGIRNEMDSKQELLNAQVAAACLLIAQLDENTDNAMAEYAAIQASEAEAYAAEQEAIAAYAAQLYAAQMAALAAAAQAGGAGAASGGSASSAYTGSLIWPVDSTYITSTYGARSAPTAGASTYHQAIDIGAAAGSPIYAAADGQVTIATYNNGLGNYVTISHDADTATRYSHMTNYIVQPGEYVTQGQIIGYVGSTGIATGDHLDYAVIQGGQSVDPLQYYDSSALTFDPTA